MEKSNPISFTVQAAALQKPYPGASISYSQGDSIQKGFHFGQSERVEEMPIGLSSGAHAIEDMKLPGVGNTPPTQFNVKRTLVDVRNNPDEINDGGMKGHIM